MNNKYLGAAVVAALAIVLLMARCSHKQTQIVENKQLAPNEKKAIIVDSGTKEITVLKRVTDKNGKTQTSQQLIEGAREVRVSVGDNGEVMVTAKTKGFSFRPGVSLGVAETLRGGVDVEWAYWNRLGVLTGLSSDKASHFAFYVGADYRLPWKLTRNTAAFVSYDSRKNIYAGLRVEL